MSPSPSDWDGSVWGAIFGAGTAVGLAVRWWYHVRRLQNADAVDGSVTKSLKFVLDELHKEVGMLKTEVALLKAENAELRASARATADRAAAWAGDSE